MASALEVSGERMTTVTRPRGPLPARVYWTRRLLLVALALLLVFGVARLLGGSDGSSGGPAAQPVGAESAPPAPVHHDRATPTGDPPGAAGARRGGHGASPATVLAAPQRELPDSDIVVTPTVKGRRTPARRWCSRWRCTTQDLGRGVHLATSRATTLAVKVTSGHDDRIWSSRSAPARCPTQDVVVRKDVPTTVKVGLERPALRRRLHASTAWAAARDLPRGRGGVRRRAGGRAVRAARRRRRATITATPTRRREPGPRQGRGQARPVGDGAAQTSGHPRRAEPTGPDRADRVAGQAGQT